MGLTQVLAPEQDKGLRDKVVIVGVGFVGLTLAMALCRKGFLVIGIEKSQKLVSELSSGNTHIIENGINEELKKYRNENRFQIIHHEDKWLRPEGAVTFILTVGTPLAGDKMDSTALEESLSQVSEYLRDDDLIILRSTVAIGTSRNLVQPFLETLNKRVFLAMCPERTIEGNALIEIENLPQIIGGFDRASGERAASFFSHICKEVIVVSTIEGAELLKLANNTYRDLMFAYANELTVLSEKIGVSSREIIDAANFHYPRSMIAMPGPSGGPCLEKDPWILSFSGAQFGVEMKLSKASRMVNESSTYRFVESIISSFFEKPNKTKVGILGLSFKGSPEVNDSRGSFARGLVRMLSSKNFEIWGFEPAGDIQPAIPEVVIYNDIRQVINECDVVIVATNHTSFKKIPDLIKDKRRKSQLVLIDMWRIIDSSELPENVVYRSWG